MGKPRRVLKTKATPNPYNHLLQLTHSAQVRIKGHLSLWAHSTFRSQTIAKNSPVACQPANVRAFLFGKESYSRIVREWMQKELLWELHLHCAGGGQHCNYTVKLFSFYISNVHPSQHTCRFYSLCQTEDKATVSFSDYWNLIQYIYTLSNTHINTH